MLLEGILNEIFPNACQICGRKINYHSFTCEKCTSILKYSKEKILKGSKNQYFDQVISLFHYHGMVKKLILKYKFQSQRYMKKAFAALITKRIESMQIKFDIIIPVPISRTRYGERGYNQSQEIANLVAKKLHVPAENRVLVKTKNNARQSQLSEKDRKKNVEGVYKVKQSSKIYQKTVLLMDDIFTTGATVSECSKMLRRNGAAKVIVLTIAYV